VGKQGLRNLQKMHLQLHLCHIQYSSIIQTTQSILQHTKPCKITRQQSSLKNVRNITNALMWKDYTFLIPCRFVPAKMQSTCCGKRRKHKTLWRDVINARHLACILWWCRWLEHNLIAMQLSFSQQNVCLVQVCIALLLNCWQNSFRVHNQVWEGNL